MYPPLQAPKRLLFGPGPSMVAPRVYEAMGQPVVGHLDPFFFQVADEIRSLLGYAFSTKNQFNIAISGTGAAGGVHRTVKTGGASGSDGDGQSAVCAADAGALRRCLQRLSQ